jgi:hypothetical protein
MAPQSCLSVELSVPTFAGGLCDALSSRGVSDLEAAGRARSCMCYQQTRGLSTGGSYLSHVKNSGLTN